MRQLRLMGLRLLAAVPIALGCVALVFILQELANVNVARSILGMTASDEAVAALNEEMGMNRPLAVRFIDYVAGIFVGDFGTSYYSATEVSDLVGQRLPITLALTILAILLSLLLSLPLAMLSASRPGGVADRLIRGLVVAGTVMPAFWVGILLIMLIALPTGLFPIGGYPRGGPLSEQIRALALPSLTLAISLMPVQIRTLRSGLRKSLESPYLEAARSRGVGTVRQVTRHALPNSVSALIAIVAVQAGTLMFLSVVVENTFRVPGLGSGIVQAVQTVDHPMVSGTTLVFALLIVAISIISDWVTIALNPLLRKAP